MIVVVPRLVVPVVPPGHMANREQPVLGTKDAVTIRPWVRTDASGVMEAFDEPSIQQWHMRRLETKREAIAWIKEWHRRWRAESDASWAVTGDDGANLLGYVALRGIDLECASARFRHSPAVMLRPGVNGGGEGEKRVTHRTCVRHTGPTRRWLPALHLQ
jgi:[ribosomal protein S5]-alanine N-acetyltransferase